ncbi:5'/3'-nucleotidase SurE [Aeromonas cavernicola]|uniref:5'-nucleotidase n=1 Tax=Aeromonas cavernicola TaxID=1006623 RepID=A0A2H9U2T7_9GAMM|nr:5'/3'-nucleotidase SurE [Aeromonas cavernicola]PJG58331.1 acid phosphatase [Aeromonas cavernicola]
MKSTRIFRKKLLLSSFMIAASFPSYALDIVLSNDDGYTANLKAIYKILVANGHRVIASIPCVNQSGKGASINFSEPLKDLKQNCLNGAAMVGDPAIGLVRGETEIYYVDGTPVMSLMYGLDVLAKEKWGKKPDLVVSGANEGQNLGSIVNTSGTVSNAQFALARQIPAIAISADVNTTNNDVLAEEVAALTFKLIDNLNDMKKSQGQILPPGYGLNVNIPTFSAGESENLPWVATKFGTFNAYNIYFTNDNGNGGAGIGFGIVGNPAPEQANDESAAIQRGNITMTMMQSGFEANIPALQWLKINMKNLSVSPSNN